MVSVYCSFFSIFFHCQLAKYLNFSRPHPRAPPAVAQTKTSSFIFSIWLFLDIFVGCALDSILRVKWSRIKSIFFFSVKKEQQGDTNNRWRGILSRNKVAIRMKKLKVGWGSASLTLTRIDRRGVQIGFRRYFKSTLIYFYFVYWRRTRAAHANRPIPCALKW